MDYRALERTLYGALSQALTEMVLDSTLFKYYNIDRFMGVCIGDNNVRKTAPFCRTRSLAISTIPLPNNGKISGYCKCVERVRYRCFKSVREEVLKSNPGKDPDSLIISRKLYNPILTEISIVFSEEDFDDNYLPF